MQALYSTDIAQALKNICLVLRPVRGADPAAARRATGRRALLRTAFWLICGLALLFAAVGFYEYATGHLLLSNAKVQEANDLKPYFRVNSLFFDPNIYGRFLALTMVALAAALLWSRAAADRGAGRAGAGACCGRGSCCRSRSRASRRCSPAWRCWPALRWSAWPVVGWSGSARVAAIGVVLLAPGAVEIDTRSDNALDKATSGRFDLVRGGAVDGARPARARASAPARSPSATGRARASGRERVAAVSHTIPLTVAAEQGMIGLAAYLALMAAALALVFHGLRARLRGDPGIADVAAAATAAAFCALVLHTLVYAAFLEDPLSWALLAIAAVLGGARGCPGAGERPRAPSARPFVTWSRC